jgi:acetyl esterase/lipase
MNKNLIHLTLLVLLSFFVCMPVLAQEFPPLPGVKTIAERTVPAPVGVSPELSAIITSHQIPPHIPAPTTQEEWLELQERWDAPFVEVSRVAAKRLGATYETKNIAGVPCYLVTPKEIGERFKDSWLVHLHGGAFVFGGGEGDLDRLSPPTTPPLSCGG